MQGSDIGVGVAFLPTKLGIEEQFDFFTVIADTPKPK